MLSGESAMGKYPDEAVVAFVGANGSADCSRLRASSVRSRPWFRRKHETRRTSTNCVSHKPYAYGIIVCMKKTLHIDDSLLRNARSACGAKTDTDTVRLGLEALVRRGAYERLRALRGSERNAAETRRRRERPSVKHSAA
jgi:Arc/MetJ family transcription regulator